MGLSLHHVRSAVADLHAAILHADVTRHTVVAQDLDPPCFTDVQQLADAYVDTSDVAVHNSSSAAQAWVDRCGRPVASRKPTYLAVPKEADEDEYQPLVNLAIE